MNTVDNYTGNLPAQVLPDWVTSRVIAKTLAETQGADTVIARVLHKAFGWPRHCEVKRQRPKQSSENLRNPWKALKTTLSASTLSGLPRSRWSLAMTAAQPMNRGRLCHPELVSGSQGCDRKARRLGFNPTSSHAAFSLPRVTLNLIQGLKQGLLQILKQVQNDSCTLKTCSAFSLVEMLMALLVASLLLAALAPVMTKRMDEAKINISGVGAAQYDKDAVLQIFTKDTEDKTFNVPNDVNNVKVTLMGGGGAGGNSFYGKQEITTSKSWTVPEGVTKLRIFMLGGGGGGASGGVGVGTAYGATPAFKINNQAVEKKEPGEYKLTDLIKVSDDYKSPALAEPCAASGKTKWIDSEDGKEISPNVKLSKYYASAEGGVKFTNLYACGGGGGGGGIGHENCASQGGAGSGAYIENKTITITENATNIIIRVGGGGGYGGTAYAKEKGGDGGFGAGGGGGAYTNCTGFGYGGTGGYLGVALGGNYLSITDNTCFGKGGYGGGSGKNGSDAITGSNTISGGTGYASGGNGGNVGPCSNATANRGGSGGGGDGNLGFGGGGGGAGGCSSAGGGGGGATLIKNGNVKIFEAPGGGGGAGGLYKCSGHSECTPGGGGGGGGAGGGAGGSATSSTNWGNGYGRGGTVSGGKSSNGSGSSGGTISGNTFGSEYCNGGNARTSGKPGAIKFNISADIPANPKAFYCEYDMPANGGGGGGAGQITVGEISVTPGETLVFTVGRGGVSRTTAGKDGDPGLATTISRKSNGEILARAEGGLAGRYSSSETAVSAGGAKRTVNILDNNWTGTTFDTKGGDDGKLSTDLLNKGFGGGGGASMNMKGEAQNGGAGGNTVKNGNTPLLTNYGAGGGGGAGAQTLNDGFGAGAAGASGYIYFEYGGTNGGGGTTGELVTKYISNLKAGTEIPITIGDGGKVTGDGNGTASKFGTYATAKGGLRGNDGGMGIAEHAKEKLLPCDGTGKYANCSDPQTKGQAATPTYGGIGGYLEQLYQNTDETWATYVKAKDGTVAGPILGGCGGNLTTLMSGITCSGAANTPHGKNGTFGGGGGGGSVVDETGGIGGNGGDGFVIIEYKGVSI